MGQIRLRCTGHEKTGTITLDFSDDDRTVSELTIAGENAADFAASVLNAAQTATGRTAVQASKQVGKPARKVAKVYVSGMSLLEDPEPTLLLHFGSARLGVHMEYTQLTQIAHALLALAAPKGQRQ